MQSLVHLADECRRHEPLINFTAYPFENYIGKLNPQIRGRSGIIQQIANAANRKDTRKLISVEKDDQLLFEATRRNSTVMLRDRSIGMIKSVNPGNMYEVQLFAEIADYFIVTMPSHKVDIFLCSGLADGTIMVTKGDIFQKGYRIDIKGNKSVYLPIIK